MSKIAVYSKTGTQLGIVESLELHDEWMAECYVTVTVKSPLPIDFGVGDYIDYRGERFTIQYDPTALKKARRGTYGEGFTYESIKFVGVQDEIVRCDFNDIVLNENGIHYTALPTFPFFCANVDDLLDRIQANLEDLYPGQWMVICLDPVRTAERGELVDRRAEFVAAYNQYIGEGTEFTYEKTNIAETVDNINCWEALRKVHDDFALNFIIRGRVVVVGGTGYYSAMNFKYGKGHGLYELEKIGDSSQQITTRLRAYGNTTNLPSRYYANLNMRIYGTALDGGTNSTDIDVIFRKDYFLNPWNGSETNIVVQIGETVYPNAVAYKNAVDETIIINTRTSDPITQGTKIYILSGVDEDKWPVSNREYGSENLPDNMAVSRLMLPGFPLQSLADWVEAHYELEGYEWLADAVAKGYTFSTSKYRPYIDSPNINKYGIRPSSIYFDGSNDNEDIHPTLEGTGVDVVVAADQIQDNGVYDTGDVPNFKITLPDLGFDLGEYWQKHTTGSIDMKDGMCGSRSFEIAKRPKQNDNNQWVCEVKRTHDDVLDLWFPYKDFNIQAGDHYTLSEIDMPDYYVEKNAEKLLKAAIEALSKNDYPRLTYQPRIDAEFMQRQDDTAKASGGAVQSLHDTLKAGDLFTFEDTDLDIDASIVIDVLTIKEYGENGIPSYEITLRDEKSVSPIEKISSKVESIISGETPVGGYTTKQIGSLIETYGEDIFLSKIYDDVAQGNMDFQQSLSVGNDLDVGGNAHIIGQTRIDGLLRALANIITNGIESEHYEGGWDNPFGSGFQINERSTDHVSFLSVDNLFVRMKAVFTELEIRKISYAGGNIIFSHAGSRIVSVTPLYDTCDVSFDGTKAVLDGSAEFAGTELQINAGGAFDGTTLKFNDSAQKLVGYRCYLMKDDGTTATENWWRVDDQARCQTFNIDETGTYHNVSNSFYWRRVMAVGTELLEDGMNYDYVDLSIIDAAAGSTVPQAGDTIVQMGNRTDTDRQGFISIQVAGEYAPSFEVYKGVNSYNLSGKRKICISPKYTEIRANKIIESTETGDYPLPHFRTDPWYTGMQCYYYDVVQHNGSSWLCIYPEGGIGGVPYTTEEPSDHATYWRIFASEGKEGKTGGETLTVYAWGTSDETAPAISGNAYPPAGWSTRITDRPTGGDYYLWMAETKKDTEGVIADWGIPACISGADGTPGEDAKNIEFIYKYDASGYDGNTGQVSPSGAASGSDTNKQQDDWVPNGWYDRALAVSESNPDVYMSSRKYNASTGTWGAFGTPTLWGHYGQKGIDGDGVQYVYKLFDHELTDAERTSNIPTKPAEPNPQGEWIPTDWSDDPQAPTSSMAFCYCSIIKEINGVWGNFEKLGLWSKWAYDGTPGGNTATVMLYKRSASAVTSVGISSTLYYKFSTKKLYTDAACTTEATTQLNGWSLTIPSNSTNQIYVTAAIAFSNTTSDDIASNEWVTPAQFTENGENGEHGINTATVFLYKRSASEITSHGITTTLYYKFTDGKLYTKSGSTYTEATDANLNNWKREIPTGDGNPCYIIQAAALGTEDYDQIATSDWSSVRKLVEDGESPYFADIDEEMDSVALDSDGKTTAAYDNTLNLMLWHGSTAIALTSLSYKVNGSASYTDERTIGNIKVTPNASAKTLRVRVANAAALTTTNEIEITIAGTGSGNKSLHFVLNGIKPGANGDPASVYKLVPSVSSVVKKNDGTYSVQNVSCTCQKVTGSAIADATDGTFTYSVDGGTEQTYTAGTNIAVTSFTKSVKFVYKKGSTVVDRETILMVEDGADGRSITKTSEAYRYATNNTGVRPDASSSDWSTTKPTLQKGYWLYTETTITWSDTSTTVLYTDERNPNDGAAGQDIIVDGSTIMKYYVGDSNTTHPAEDSSDWKDLNQVTQTQGKWLWSQATTWYRKSSSASGAHDGGKSVNYNVSYISKDGAAGRGVTSVTEYYKANNSTTAPAVDDNQWDTDPNLSHLTDKWDANHIYLWNYEKVTYSSGTSVERTTPQIVAIWTEDGAPGKGIDSIQDYYKITNSLTPPARTDTGWSSSPVAPIAENPYLYNYEAITWVNPSSTTYTAVQMIGHFGKDGISVRAQYSANGTSWHDTFASTDEWMRTSTDNGTTWSTAMKIVGEDGGETDFSFGISQYKVTANAQTAPSDISSWSDAPVAVTEQKPYLWSKVQQKDGDGNVTSTRYIRLTGEKGIAAAVAICTPQVVSIPVNTSDKALDDFRQVVPISMSTGSEELSLFEVTILSGGTNVELGPSVLKSHAGSQTTFSSNTAVIGDAHFNGTTLVVEDEGSTLVPTTLIVKGAKNATITDHVCEIQVRGYDSEMNEYTAKTSLSIVRNVEGKDGPNGQNGDNAVNVSLTPQSVILTQNTAGAMPTLTDANTTINVKEGDEDVTSQATIISATPSTYVVSGATYDTCTCSISSKKVIITAIAQHGTETVGEDTINKYAEQGYIDIVVRYNGVDTTLRFNFYCNLLGTWKREVVGDAEYTAAHKVVTELDSRGIPSNSEYDYAGVKSSAGEFDQWTKDTSGDAGTYQYINQHLSDAEQNIWKVRAYCKNRFTGVLTGQEWRSEPAGYFDPHPARYVNVDTDGYFNVVSGDSYMAKSVTLEREKQYTLSIKATITSNITYYIFSNGSTMHTYGSLIYDATTGRHVSEYPIKFSGSGSFTPFISFNVAKMKQPQIEEGNQSTEFDAEDTTVGSTIKQTANQITAAVNNTGVDITNGLIRLRGGKVEIEESVEVPTVMSVNDDMYTQIQAGGLEIRSKSTASFGLFQLNSEGEIILTMYDKSGNCVVSLGGTPSAHINGEWKTLKLKAVDPSVVSGGLSEFTNNGDGTSSYQLRLGKTTNSGSTLQYFTPSGLETTDTTVKGRDNCVFTSKTAINYTNVNLENSDISALTPITFGWYVLPNNGMFMQDIDGYYRVRIYQYDNNGRCISSTDHRFTP